MIYVVGRTGVGKDYFGKLLQSELGLKPVISNTDRPRRKNESEDSHHFLDPNFHYFYLPEKNAMECITYGADGKIDQDATYYINDIVAETKIGHYTYFATKEDLKNADYYIIDPNGLKNISFSDENDILVYIHSDDMLRFKNTLDRTNSIFESALTFTERDEAEDYQFKQFGYVLDLITHTKLYNENVFVVSNDFVGDRSFLTVIDKIRKKISK